MKKIEIDNCCNSEEVRDIEYTDDSLRYYFREIDRYPLLTREEEVELFKRLAAGEIGIRQKIIESNLRLVVSIARRYNNLGVDFLDLIQDGNEGLIKAVDGYDVDRNNCFSTYATPSIENYIKNGIYKNGRTIKISHILVWDIIKMKKVQKQFCLDFGREPTNEEIALGMEVSVDYIKKLIKADEGCASLNDLLSKSQTEIIETILDENSYFEDKCITKLLASELITALMNLSDTNKKIIYYRFISDERQTLTAISESLGISRAAVGQREKKILKGLKNKLNQDEKFVKKFHL